MRSGGKTGKTEPGEAFNSSEAGTTSSRTTKFGIGGNSVGSEAEADPGVDFVRLRTFEGSDSFDEADRWGPCSPCLPLIVLLVEVSERFELL